MKPNWTGDLISKMHVHEVTYEELARELGVGKPYVGMILNGRRNPPDAKERLQAAFERVLKKRKFPEA